MLAKLRQKGRTAKQFAFFNAPDTDKSKKKGKTLGRFSFFA
jgi:hypothetical protein